MILALALLFVTLAVLGTVLSPLWQRGGWLPSRSRYERAVYRDQLAGIERDVARGIVRPDDAAAARREIERRFLAAAEAPEAPTASAPKPAMAAILGVVAAAFALVLYLALGSPSLRQTPVAGGGPAPAQEAAIKNMVAGLATRLQNGPNNLQGWLMLGHSYAVLGQNDKAADAYEHARQIKSDDPDIALAEAAALLAGLKIGDAVPDRAVALLKAVTAKEPDQPMALWFLGLAAAQQHDFVQARDDWHHLLRVIPADAPERSMVTEALDAIQSK